MYKCKYFSIRELVNPEILKEVSENTLWILFDESLLRGADAIREIYGAITINSGSWVDCGLRKIDSKNSAKWSAHKFARALDLHIVALDKKYANNKAEKVKAYNKVRKDLMANPKFDCLNFEQNSKANPDGITWLHIDTFNRPNRLFNA